MTTFAYSAVDSHGKETKGTIQATNQAEVLQRLKEMGFFPMKVALMAPPLSPAARVQRHAARLGLRIQSRRPPCPTPIPRAHQTETAGPIHAPTRHLGVEAGMPFVAQPALAGRAGDSSRSSNE